MIAKSLSLLAALSVMVLFTTAGYAVQDITPADSTPGLILQETPPQICAIAVNLGKTEVLVWDSHVGPCPDTSDPNELILALKEAHGPGYRALMYNIPPCPSWGVVRVGGLPEPMFYDLCAPPEFGVYFREHIGPSLDPNRSANPETR